MAPFVILSYHYNLYYIEVRFEKQDIIDEIEIRYNKLRKLKIMYNKLRKLENT